MKNLVIVGLVIVLAGCGGGFDDMDAARDAFAGIGSNGSDNNQPSNPNEKSNWQYSSVSNENGVFSLSATNYSINTYQKPDYENLRGKPWIKLERDLSRDGIVTDTVVIFTGSNVSCLPSCDIRMSFDGNWATYKMQHVIDGVIRPIDDATGKTLFKKFTTSNRATVNLPIIGLSEPFDANFNLSGYDIKQMKF